MGEGKYTQLTRNVTKRYAHFIEAILLSTGLAFLMLCIAFGLMFIFGGEAPIEYPYLLLIFALSFIIGSVFFEKQMVNRLNSLFYGCLTSLIITFILTTLVGGIKFVLPEAGKDIPGTDVVISSLAVCMVISMVIVNLLAYE